MNNALQKVFLIPWSGPWPHWFSYFLESCRMNPSFTWYFFTDNVKPADLPVNVFIHNLSLAELSGKASTLLGCHVNLVHPYKLVDLKPAYGLLFHDYIKDYDFWGHTDIDLVYGNIQHFLPDELISQYDIISPDTDFIPGHFCLLRNTEEIRHLFKRCPDWRMIFSSPECYLFDEFLFEKGFSLSGDSVYKFIRKKIRQHIRKKKILRRAPFKRLISKIIKITPGNAAGPKDFNSVIRQSETVGDIKVYREDLYRDEIMNLIEGRKIIDITWENGRLSENEKEIMYFHFQLSKYSSGLYFRDIPGRQNSYVLQIDLSDWK